MNLRCRFGFHDYDYFTMTRLDGGIEHHRCCLRCEKSQLLSVDYVLRDLAQNLGMAKPSKAEMDRAKEVLASDKLGIKITRLNESKAAFATVRDDILGARKSMGSFATEADLVLLNSDAAQAQTPQDIGRGNLLALFGVEKSSANKT